MAKEAKKRILIEFAGDAKDALRAQAKVETSLDELQQSAKEAAKAFRGISLPKKVLSGLSDASSGVEDVTQATSKLDGSLDKIDFDGVGKSAKGSFSIMGAMVAELGASIVTSIVGAIGDAISSIGELTSEFEQSAAKISASLDLPKKASDELNDALAGGQETAQDFSVAAQNVWAHGFADIEESTQAVIFLKRQFRDMTANEIAEFGVGVTAVADIFEQDIGRTVDAMGALAKEFGISEDAALDFITQGLQDINPAAADDFLQTIGEYSNQFADAGFSAQEFYSILETGSKSGVLGTDKIADAIKEFSIRMLDGSTETEKALRDLYYITSENGESFQDLQRDIEGAEGELKNAEDGLASWKEQVERNKDTVENLRDALDEARDKLDELSRPELAGMKKYEDAIWKQEQAIKAQKLAMISLDEQSDTYKRQKEKLDSLNDELDRLELERDLEMEPKLRALEEAASEGREGLQTFEQAMADIEKQKGHIGNLEQNLEGAQGTLEQSQSELQRYQAQVVASEQKLAGLNAELSAAAEPARDFLQGLSDGSMTVRDALPLIIDKLNQIEDPIQRNRIAAALFGTQMEDMGAEALLAIDMTQSSMEDLAGSWSDAVGDGTTSSMRLQKALRDILVAVTPLIQGFKLFLIEAIMPITDEYGPQLIAWLRDEGPRAMAGFQAGLTPLIDSFVGFITDVLIPLIQEYGPKVVSWFKNDFSQAVSGFYVVINAAKPVLAPFMELLKVKIELFKKIVEVVTACIKAFEGVIGAVTYVVAVFQGAISPIAGIKGAFRELIDPLVKLYDTLRSMLVPIDGVLAGLKAIGEVSLPDWQLPEWLGGSSKASKKKRSRGRPKRRAEGGPLDEGDVSIVGEKGPELFVPHRSGFVVPNKAVGGNNVNVTMSAPITINGNADETVVQQINDYLRSQIDALYLRLDSALA